MEHLDMPLGIGTQPPHLKEILYELVFNITIEHIYLSSVRTGAHCVPVLIIIIGDKANGPINKLLPMVHKIVLGRPCFYYRMYHSDHIAEGIKNGNLFFINGCTPEKMVFCGPWPKQCPQSQNTGIKEVLIIAKRNFNQELHKVKTFWEGADFYRERGHFSQAAFMLHQTLELLFRTLERFMMGKEKVCHHIGNHQNYIRPFAPALGKLFDTERSEEAALLQLLDKAYVAVRYGDGYQITKEGLQSIQHKAIWLYKEVKRLFENSLDACKHESKTNSYGNQ